MGHPREYFREMQLSCARGTSPLSLFFVDGAACTARIVIERSGAARDDFGEKKKTMVLFPHNVDDGLYDVRRAGSGDVEELLLHDLRAIPAFSNTPGGERGGRAVIFLLWSNRDREQYEGWIPYAFVDGDGVRIFHTRDQIVRLVARDDGGYSAFDVRGRLYLIPESLIVSGPDVSRLETAEIIRVHI